MSKSPVRIALCGKIRANGQQFIEWSKPEYEVVHHCESVADAQRELPAVLRGEAIKPSTGLGSNSSPDRQFAQPFEVVVVGAGFSREELEELRGIEALKDVVWLYPDNTKAGPGKPTLEAVVGRMKEALRRIGLGGDVASVKPGLYEF